MGTDVRVSHVMGLVTLSVWAMSSAVSAEAGGVRGGGEALWPAADVKAVPAYGARIGRLQSDVLQIQTATSNRWSGVRLIFDGVKDLSTHDFIVAVVTNRSNRDGQIVFQAKAGKAEPAFAVRNTIRAREAAEIVLPLAQNCWRTDARVGLAGMRTQPVPWGDDAAIGRLSELVLFDSKDHPVPAFGLVSVAAEGLSPRCELPRLSAKGFCPFVDRFGQFVHFAWSGKVRNEADLRDDASRERRPALPFADRDRFGGWMKGPRLSATGFFRTEKVNGKWWLVDPDGHLFYSHGICGVRTESPTPVSGREGYFQWLPDASDEEFAGFFSQGGRSMQGFYSQNENCPCRLFDFAGANLLRKYGPDWRRSCAEAVHRRCQDWGINTLACWSDRTICSMDRTPYVVWFPCGGPKIQGTTGWWGKFYDVFDPRFAEEVRRRVCDEAKRSGNDPWCLGWFVDNELSWGKTPGALGHGTLASPDGQPAKVEFLRRLKAKYGEAFETNKVTEADCEAFSAVLARTYFRIVREAIKAVAPHRLYLGCRFAGMDYGEGVLRAAAEYCDVVSVNQYAFEPRIALPDGATDRPCMIGEFHFGALDRGMFAGGNGGKTVKSQQVRANCYRRYHQAALDDAAIVGAHWFLWRDQPLTGRLVDGENLAVGFVSVTDRPYSELVDAARQVSAEMYVRRFGMGNAGLVEPSKPIPRAVPREIRCERTDYPFHLQGVSTDGTNVYWSFTTVLAKTDLAGRETVRFEIRREEGHMGDLKWRNGKVYVGTNRGVGPNGVRNGDEIWVFDDATLKLESRHPTPEAVWCNNGLEAWDGSWWVISSVPKHSDCNYLFEYSSDFKFKTCHAVKSGWTNLGVQVILLAGDRLLLGCYGDVNDLRMPHRSGTIVMDPAGLRKFASKRDPTQLAPILSREEGGGSAEGLLMLDGRVWEAHAIRLSAQGETPQRWTARLKPSARLTPDYLASLTNGMSTVQTVPCNGKREESRQ